MSHFQLHVIIILNDVITGINVDAGQQQKTNGGIHQARKLQTTSFRDITSGCNRIREQLENTS